MVRDFGEKLRLTAAALSCESRKDLAAAFRRANPTTHFDVERADKWLRGRALPRDESVYRDWHRVVALDRDLHWLLTCSPGELATALADKHGISADRLLAQPEPFGRAKAAATGNVPEPSIAGRYVVYALSFSPYRAGQLTRGLVDIWSAGAGQLASYVEQLQFGPVRFDGPVTFGGRGTQLKLTRTDALAVPLDFHLFLPSQPSYALAGLMCGSTTLELVSPPTVSRTVLVRLPDSAPPPVDLDLYVSEGTSLAAELAACGLPLVDLAAADAVLRRLLLGSTRPGMDQVPADDYATLISVFHQQWLAGKPPTANANQLGSVLPPEGQATSRAPRD